MINEEELSDIQGAHFSPSENEESSTFLNVGPLLRQQLASLGLIWQLRLIHKRRGKREN